MNALEIPNFVKRTQVKIRAKLSFGTIIKAVPKKPATAKERNRVIYVPIRLARIPEIKHDDASDIYDTITFV